MKCCVRIAVGARELSMTPNPSSRRVWHVAPHRRGPKKTAGPRTKVVHFGVRHITEPLLAESTMPLIQQRLLSLTAIAAGN